MYDVDLDYIEKVLVLTTHKSCSIPKFYEFLDDEDFDCSFCFIGDEMHGLGSCRYRNALRPQYKYRLGLSATPKRHFDDFGTDVLFEYFGEEAYIFSLKNQ